MEIIKILVVDDEARMRKLVKDFLSVKGYKVIEAADGEEAIDIFMEQKDIKLVLLDVMMPKMDGFETLKLIRQYSNIPVIMLTARTQIKDRVKGLDLGANDYLIKPFHFDELEARIRSLLRRKQVQEDSTISAFGLVFDTKTKTASVNDERIKLTVKETGILEYLLLNQGRYVLQEELLEHVWESDMNEFSNTVRVHVYGLRNKLKDALGKNIIRNEIGRGYIIDKE